MSAHSFTDWRISCNRPGCTTGVWASQCGVNDVFSAQQLRRVLRERGWKVNVPATPSQANGWSKREDYCPDHQDEEG